jgi:hypothetical protein
MALQALGLTSELLVLTRELSTSGLHTYREVTAQSPVQGESLERTLFATLLALAAELLWVYCESIGVDSGPSGAIMVPILGI